MHYPVIIAALLVLNIVTILIFAWDKRAALLQARRVPERSLLIIALMGGTPGAYWARRRFRHKTYEQPFSRNLHLIAVGQSVALLALLAILLGYMTVIC